MCENRMANAELVKRLKSGDTSAFQKIFNLFEKRLYHFAFSYTKSEYVSEEIIQEVFIKLWENRNKLDSSRSFDSYMYTVTRNLTFNYLRDASRRQSTRKEFWTNITLQRNSVEEDLIFREYGEIVEDIIRELPQQKRSIYQLSRQEGKSNSEIADILGISSKTVKNHLWKTMSIIRSQLRPYIDETIRFLLLLFFLN